MIAFMWCRGSGRAFPEGFARLPIQRQDDEPVFESGIGTAAAAAQPAGGWLSSAGRHRSRQKDPVSDRDWRGMSAPGNGDFPGDIGVIVPAQGRVAHRHSGVERAAPLLPVARLRHNSHEDRYPEENRSRVNHADMPQMALRAVFHNLCLFAY
jgi:hypothetical protein